MGGEKLLENTSKDTEGLVLLGEFGKEDLATLYVAYLRGKKDHVVEFVESVQPPIPREKKWVNLISTLFGCPVGCAMCDAGGTYRGPLTAEEILSQILFMVDRHYPRRAVPVEKYKIQFARMGEPSFNDAVLDVLERLPEVLDAPGLIPSISTIAPAGREAFFERLLAIKNRLYAGGRFQMQFSIHTTDDELRNQIIPIKKWGFEDIGKYGERFYREGDRKITLNFSPAPEWPVSTGVLREHFNPDVFLIKLTPLNPTEKVINAGMKSLIDPANPAKYADLVRSLERAGYDVIVSIGALEENQIGSNCGQYATLFGSNNRLCIREKYSTMRYLRYTSAEIGRSWTPGTENQHEKT